jgi:hypothetical protein
MRTRQDRARISRQAWEVDYVRTLAKDLLAIDCPGDATIVVSRTAVRRVARAYLKLTKPKKK